MRLKKSLRNLELEGQGRGIIMGVTRLLLLGPFYTLQSLTGKYREIQGKPCNENREPAMRTGFPCNESRFFLWELTYREKL